MEKFLVKRFVKNYEQTDDPKVREGYGALAGGVGIASNVVLCVIKILTGLIFGSIAVLADGINNLSDASASLITLIGFKLAGKAPDNDHPYGHGRTEYLTALIISVMVLVIGVSLLKSSVEKIVNPEPAEFSVLTVAVLVVAIAIKLWQAGFNTKLGKTINSDALMATAADSRNDVISTGAVLIATVAGKIFGINLDGPAGVLVAAFIIWSGIGLVKDALGPILGQAPDPKLANGLKELMLANDTVLGVHDLVVHDYGPGRIFASAHAEVDAKGDIMEIHDLIDNLEKEAYNNLRVLLTIHMDPLDTKDPLVAKLNQQLTEVISGWEDIKSFHDLRVVAGSTHINVIFDVVLAFSSKLTPAQAREQLQEKLRAYNPKYCCVITVDREYA